MRKKIMADHKKQHYVPQCYLKHFSPNGTFVYIYNKDSSIPKMNGKPIKAAIDSICQSKYFYNVTDPKTLEIFKREFKKDGIEVDEKVVETYFFAEEVEDEWGAILDVLEKVVDRKLMLKEKDTYTIKEEERYLLAKHIFFQFLRMPQVRENEVRVREALLEELNKKLLPKGDPGRFVFDSPVAPEDLQLVLMNNGEFFQHFVGQISKNYWAMYISPNDVFYTSDYPIVIIKHDPLAQAKCYGLTQHGGEISFPLNSRLVLKIWDKDFFPEKKDLDGKILFADEDFVQMERTIQTVYATRLVISKTPDLSIPQRLKQNIGRELFARKKNCLY